MPELYEEPLVTWGIGWLPLGTCSRCPFQSLLKIGASSVETQKFLPCSGDCWIVVITKFFWIPTAYFQVLRTDRSGKANSSWIYTALLNLQLHTPAHTQAHSLQQSPWPLRGCGDTWVKYLEILWSLDDRVILGNTSIEKDLNILGYLNREEEEKSISGMSLVFEPSSCLDNVAIGV